MLRLDLQAMPLRRSITGVQSVQENLEAVLVMHPESALPSAYETGDPRRGARGGATRSVMQAAYVPK